MKTPEELKAQIEKQLEGIDQAGKRYLAEIKRLTEMNANLAVAANIAVDELDERDEEIERLKKALLQALSHGVPPRLPDLDDYEEGWNKETVLFFYADENSYPQQCPELAEFLRKETEGNDPETTRYWLHAESDDVFKTNGEGPRNPLWTEISKAEYDSITQ